MARSKYTERFCPYCNKQSRMEIVGGMEGVVEKSWFKCTRCRHLSLLSVESNGASGGKTGRNLDPNGATPYDPAQLYVVGQTIFHTEWNDVGKVVNKVVTSGGGQAIVVAFDRLGERRLVENTKVDVMIDQTMPTDGQNVGN